MKDCLIISFFSKNETGFGKYYTDALDAEGCSYDVIYFERYQGNANPAPNELLYSRYCPTGGSKLGKIGIMLGYMRFVRRALRQGRYRSVIVLTTMPAMMICDMLLGRYKKKFILDIRDYTHENIPVYRRLLGRLVKAAHATVISSRGFIEFLPEHDKYICTHNIAGDYTPADGVSMIGRDTFRIGFVGSVRYFRENSRLISQLHGNARYSLSYYGTHAADCDLQAYCTEQGFDDVFFGGRFNNSEKSKIYRDIDIINSIYGTDGRETTTAVPNRLYDAAIYRCPIIVSSGTYLATIVEEYGIGFAVDIHHQDIAALLDDYISNFDADRFEQGCARLLADVEQDMAAYRAMLAGFAAAAHG